MVVVQDQLPCRTTIGQPWQVPKSLGEVRNYMSCQNHSSIRQHDNYTGSVDSATDYRELVIRLLQDPEALTASTSWNARSILITMDIKLWTKPRFFWHSTTQSSCGNPFVTLEVQSTCYYSCSSSQHSGSGNHPKCHYEPPATKVAASLCDIDRSSNPRLLTLAVLKNVRLPSTRGRSPDCSAAPNFDDFKTRIQADTDSLLTIMTADQAPIIQPPCKSNRLSTSRHPHKSVLHNMVANPNGVAVYPCDWRQNRIFNIQVLNRESHQSNCSNLSISRLEVCNRRQFSSKDSVSIPMPCSRIMRYPRSKAASISVLLIADCCAQTHHQSINVLWSTSLKAIHALKPQHCGMIELPRSLELASPTGLRYRCPYRTPCSVPIIDGFMTQALEPHQKPCSPPALRRI
jgi:hypothetical protein